MELNASILESKIHITHYYYFSIQYCLMNKQNHQSKGHHALGTPNFVRKLLSILEDYENSELIKWVNEGQGFQLNEEDKFAKLVLPKYFRHSNIHSFIRQLNMYGFRKIKEGDFQFYMHPYFIKGEPNLCNKINRKPEKKLGSSKGECRSNKKQKSDQLLSLEDIEQQLKGKRVRFMDLTNTCKISQSSSSIKPSMKQLSQKGSLANLLGKSQGTILGHPEIQDALSICQHLQQKSEQIQQNSDKDTKLIFWTPSAILSKRNIKYN